MINAIFGQIFFGLVFMAIGQTLKDLGRLNNPYYFRFIRRIERIRSFYKKPSKVIVGAGNFCIIIGILFIIGALAGFTLP